MSTSQQIQAVRGTEQRYPADLIHNGHTYKKGCKPESRALRRAIRRIRALRIHRVEVHG